MEFHLPQCVQASALHFAAQVGCGTDFYCACNNELFLFELQPQIYIDCTGADIQAGLSESRSYCTVANPSLLATRRSAFVPLMVVFTSLTITAVALRLWARQISKARYGLDDYLAVGALIFALIENALELAGLRWGEGIHQFLVDQHTQYLSSKSTLASGWMIGSSLILAKNSILALYYRLFGHDVTFRRIIIITSVVCTVIQLMTLLFLTFSCHPINYFFDKTIKGGTCWNFQKVLVGVAASDLGTGLFILLLPIPVLASLHTTNKRKALLIGLFTIGGFTCVAAAIRIPFVLLVDNEDIFWSLVPFTIWSNIELNTGVISICLPALKPIFDRYSPGPRMAVSTTSKNSSFPNDIDGKSQKHQRLRDDIETGKETFSRLPGRGRTNINGSSRTTVKTPGPLPSDTTSTTDKERLVGEQEGWPMGAISVTKEVDVCRDGETPGGGITELLKT